MAGMVSKDVIDRIRGSLDIADIIGSYIQVKRAGASAKALCPFHKEKTPSFGRSRSGRNLPSASVYSISGVSTASKP